jgi:hypothetical protein
MARLINLNLKNGGLNVITQGNPETKWPHVLKTISSGNAVASLDIYPQSLPALPTGLTWARTTTATVMAYAPTAVAGDLPILTTCAIAEARFQNARRVSQGVWSNVLNDGSAIPLPITLLCEEERRNLCLNSAAIVTPNYTSTPTLATGQLAPDGSNNASLMTGSGTAAIQRMNQAVAGITANIVFTVSIYIKAGSCRYVTLQGLGSSNGFHAIVDTTTMTFSNTTNVTGTGTFISRAISSAPLANGFYKVSVTGSSPDTGSFIRVILTNNANSAAPSFSTTETVILWGAQLVAASGQSSDIITGATAVTRTADVPSFTGSGLSWYNVQQGTFAITAAGTGFNAPYDLGALGLTYAAQTKYVLGYNNSAKIGSTYLYTAATVDNPTEYTGVAVPTTLYLSSAGVANISRFTYYPKALKPSKMAALL